MSCAFVLLWTRPEGPLRGLACKKTSSSGAVLGTELDELRELKLVEDQTRLGCRNSLFFIRGQYLDYLANAAE